jgi:hypothetical protein
VSEAGRIDDMLEEVKAIARRRGRFERATLAGLAPFTTLFCSQNTN